MINVSGTTETWYYYYTDALGSVRFITDHFGVIKESYAYGPFGRALVMYGEDGDGDDDNWFTEDSSSLLLYSPLGNPYMFTARRWDYNANLYYYRFRDYQPDLGRFCQPDPIGYYGSMNLYQYCLNSPTNWFDPWGLWTEEAHRDLGKYGRTKFDYAQLDEDFPATTSRRNRERHFRKLRDALRDARAAARQGLEREFEYHMHEVQDYFAHRARGFGPTWGHLFHGHAPDDPTRPENQDRYRRAEIMTRRLEDFWDRHNPPDPPESRKDP